MTKSLNADIYLDKGLYELAKKELEVITDEYSDTSFPIERLLLLRRKSILMYFENYENTSLEDIKSLYEKRIRSAEQMILEIKFARILSILSWQYFHGQKDNGLLQSFMKEPYMNDESFAKEFATKYLYHWVRAQFEEFNNNPTGALLHFNKSIQLWLENERFIEAHPRMYLGACFNYFKHILHQEEFFSNTLLHINFEQLISKLKDSTLSKDSKLKYQYLFLTAEILSLKSQNKHEEIIALTTPFIRSNPSQYIINAYEKVIFLYWSAQAQFRCGNYDKSEDILHPLVNPISRDLEKNKLFLPTSIYLYLISLIELKQYKYCNNLITKYKAYLKKIGKLHKLELDFLNTLSKLISPRYSNLQAKVLKQFIDKISGNSSFDFSELNPQFVFYLEWAKSKFISLQ